MLSIETNVEVRLVKYEELDQLLSLYGQLNNDDPILQKEQISDLWFEIFNDPNLYYVVVDVNGKLVSTCCLAIIKNLTRNAHPYGLVENVVTHLDFRRKGYGKLVLTRALEIAWSKKCYKAMLLTGSKREETLEFYENVGFQRGIKTGFVALPPLS